MYASLLKIFFSIIVYPRRLYFAVPYSEVKSLSCVWLFATPWTVACQAPPPMGFSRQEYWSGLPFPSPGDLPNQGIEPGLLHCRQMLLPSEPPGKSYRTKPPTNARCQQFFILEKTIWSQIKGTREAHQEITWEQIKGVQALHTPWSLSASHSWTIAIKLLTKSSRVLTVFKGRSLPCLPLPGKAIKLFFSNSPQLCLQDLIWHQCTEAEFSASEDTTWILPHSPWDDSDIGKCSFCPWQHSVVKPH